MPYYCKDCDKTHPGWPQVENRSPEEYLHLGEKEKKKCFIHDDSIIISNNGHTHCYVPAYWRQKVEYSFHLWNIKVWVMFGENSFISLKNNEESEFEGTLQNMLPWYGPKSIGIPITIRKDGENLYVTDVNVDCLIKEEFKTGLKREIADSWVKEITENVSMTCETKKQ